MTDPNYQRGADAAMNCHLFGKTPPWELIEKANPLLRKGFHDTWEALKK